MKKKLTVANNNFFFSTIKSFFYKIFFNFFFVSFQTSSLFEKVTMSAFDAFLSGLRAYIDSCEHGNELSRVRIA